MFCGVAANGGGAADIGRHRQRQEIGNRIAPERQRQLGDERRQHQADRVVDEKSRVPARGYAHAQEQQQRMARLARDSTIGEREEAGEAQIGDEDHHAEQQRDGVEIDGAIGLLEAEAAARHHQTGADQRGAGAVESHPGKRPRATRYRWR